MDVEGTSSSQQRRRRGVLNPVERHVFAPPALARREEELARLKATCLPELAALLHQVGGYVCVYAGGGLPAFRLDHRPRHTSTPHPHKQVLHDTAAALEGAFVAPGGGTSGAVAEMGEAQGGQRRFTEVAAKWCVFVCLFVFWRCVAWIDPMDGGGDDQNLGACSAASMRFDSTWLAIE